MAAKGTIYEDETTGWKDAVSHGTINEMKIYIFKPHIVYDFNNSDTLKLHGEEECNCCHTWDYYHPNVSNREIAFVYGHIPTITAFAFWKKEAKKSFA